MLDVEWAAQKVRAGKKNLQTEGPGVWAKPFVKFKIRGSPEQLTQLETSIGVDPSIILQYKQRLLWGVFWEGLSWATEVVVRTRSSSGGG